VEILAPYSVEFTPDSQYSVRLAGANNNIFDVEGGILVQNQVQVIPTNSAGLVVVGESGLSPTQNDLLVLIAKILRNKMITDPTTGTLTIYDDDGVTPLVAGLTYEDAPGTQTYRGQGAERRERLQ
jgi:hypothetical protein